MHDLHHQQPKLFQFPYIFLLFIFNCRRATTRQQQQKRHVCRLFCICTMSNVHCTHNVHGCIFNHKCCKLQLKDTILPYEQRDSTTEIFYSLSDSFLNTDTIFCIVIYVYIHSLTHPHALFLFLSVYAFSVCSRKQQMDFQTKVEKQYYKQIDGLACDDEVYDVRHIANA